MNPERHRNNLDLAISGDENVLRNKVKEQYDKAFLELTADMGMKFDMATGMATVKPRIAAKAGLGGYTFKLQADSPTHLTSTIDLKPIEGSFDLAGRNFKYSSKLSVRVDVTLHPTPKGGADPIKVPKVISSERPVKDSADSLIQVVVVTTILVMVYFILTKGAAAVEQIGKSINPAMQRMQQCPGIRSPFMYTINPKDSRLNA